MGGEPCSECPHPHPTLYISPSLHCLSPSAPRIQALDGTVCHFSHSYRLCQPNPSSAAENDRLCRCRCLSLCRCESKESTIPPASSTCLTFATQDCVENRRQSGAHQFNGGRSSSMMRRNTEVIQRQEWEQREIVGCIGHNHGFALKRRRQISSFSVLQRMRSWHRRANNEDEWQSEFPVQLLHHHDPPPQTRHRDHHSGIHSIWPH